MRARRRHRPPPRDVPEGPLALLPGALGYSPDYRAELGHTQRSDTNRWSAVLRYNGPPTAGGLLRTWSAVNTLLAQFDWRGRMQYAYVYPRLLLTFPRQSSLNLYGYTDYVRVFEEELGAARSGGRLGARNAAAGE
ncbi:MAG: hypothetical protein AB7O37_01485 [Vicinamibacteria bacterium]